MTKVNMNRSLYVCAGLAVLALVAFGCGGCSNTSGPRYEMPVTLAAAFEGGQMVINVTSVTLTVSAEDMGTITRELTVSNGQVEAVVDVPPGMDRLFQLDAYNDTLLIYSGSETTDVGLGEEITLIIHMIPQVLMLKVNPAYQDIMISQTEHYFDIFVHNPLNLFGASFRINFADAVINPINVVFSEQGDNGFDNLLGPDFLSFYRIDSNYVAIAVTRFRGDAGVTASGGRLARIYFNPLSEGYSPLEFDPTTDSLTQPDGSPVVGSTSIILQNGEVVVGIPQPE
jgi:hypothetical protein